MAEERFVRRTGDDYADAWSDLLPVGKAWPRDRDSTLQKTISGLAQIWGLDDARAGDLLERETDPRLTTEMLAEWERAFGLPDPCVPVPQTTAERRAALILRMTVEGGQSRAFFISVAARLGYSIAIREYSPYMCGASRCGDTRTSAPGGEHYRWETAPPEIRFYWSVRFNGPRTTWFRVGAGGGQTGVDPMVRITYAWDLECVFRRWKPAHTEVIFDYSAPITGANTMLEWFRVSDPESRTGVDPHLQILII